MSKKRTGFVAWYDKVTAWNVEDLFVKRKPPGPPRTIFVNEPLPEDHYDHKHRIKKEYTYEPNQVITSKYTVFTFFPRNLLEQFRRIANVFFLAIAVLQFFPKFSTISPGLVILPLIVVLGITALKDAYEDVKRHQSDRRVNYSEVRVLAGGSYANHNTMKAKSRTFVRGLRRSGHGKTKKPEGDLQNLEGAPPEALDASSGPQILEDDPALEYDDGAPPPADDEAHHGLFHHHHGPGRPHWKRTIWEDLRVGDFVKITDHEAIPADILICATSEDENVAFVETKNLDGETNLKSRNAVAALTHLRTATACADPKNAFRVDCDRPEVLMHKLNAAAIVNGERSPVDLQTTLLRGTVLRNTSWVIGVVMYTGLDTKAVLNAGGTPSKRSKVERQMNPMVFANLLLLGVMVAVCGIVDSVLEHRYYPRNAPWLFDDNRRGDNPSINGLITAVFALITFQNIVPISLYISIEVVRTCQAAFIYFDSEIFDEKLGQATVAKSFTLSDDLGQIEYIFSDKTGTLTQNAMVFRRASVGGKVYIDEPLPEEDPVEPENEKELLKSTPDLAQVSDVLSASSSQKHGSTGDIPHPLEASGVKLSGGVLQRFRNATLSTEISNATATQSADRLRIDSFWTVLALCHTVLAGVDPHTGALEYKAQSPDEAALVQAAADVGFEFRGRDRDVLFLRTPFSPEPQRFRLLNILDFTSSRKRMSVLVRRLPLAGEAGQDTGPVVLLTKGADNVIFERLADGSDELKDITETQLDEFAREGLRTLTLAYRNVAEEEYQSWLERYQEAIAAIEDRETLVEAVSNEIEQGLTLVGATAIEDRLQDGVPETIADLKHAGIKIWVLTGDKLETAIAIGHSTNLIASDANIVIIRGKGDTGRSIYAQMLRATEEYFPETGILNDPMVNTEQLSAEASNGYPLHRVNTGITSIVGSQNGQRPGGYVLVIDGLALEEALSDDRHKHLLLQLAIQCEAVVCCRVSPKQKAFVVKLVKDGLDTMTLAIGDGANDVSMIQAADVGVGISGEEGLQAVNSSDYAIAQFRYLKRLLLVHGHWSYARNGNMITNFFYKNIICIGVLWWYQIYCGWSSAYVFEYTYLLFWNSFWTIAPVIAIGLFDRLIDDRVLMAIPQLYRYGREGKWFGAKLFTVYMVEGVVQSAIVFFIILYGYFSPTARNDGYDVAQYEFATVMAISAAIAANLFNGLNTRVWTGWVFFAVFIGIVLIWVYTAVYSVIAPGWFSTPVYGNDHFLFHSALFWLSIPLTFLLALLPRYLWTAWSFGFDPNDIDILRWNYRLNPQMDLIHDAYLRQSKEELAAQEQAVPPTPYSASRPSMTAARGSQIDMSTGLHSQSRGFDFATEENGVAMRRIQSNLSGVSPAPNPERRNRRSQILRSIRHPLSRRKRPPTEISEE
ncbi:phospholipid-translocating P-type ATPase [Auriscalpium vulgare]|uniref:Phospholipid-translocating P-type ATPase n=1 Tax=Auriscalpium vulgare TaxID=40419 RepID=A0ACB8SBZ0_9AGAM|nr:phospholipid-translocating P-type ATPase [Auriscalpium vulgare]